MAKLKQLAQKKGFTLVELLVVLAILAILVAVAVPVYMNMTESSKKTICSYHIAEADRLYLVYRVMSDSDTPLESMERVLLESFHATKQANGHFTGVCPSGGEYEITEKDGVARITCLKHNISGGGGSFTSFDGIDMLLNLKDITLDANGATKTYSSILDYLETRYKGGDASIDSEADHLGDLTVAKQIENALSDAYPSIDFKTNSWRIYYNGASKIYTITWSDRDISKLEIGTPITVTQYDQVSNSYRATTLATVGEKTDSGTNKKVKFIDLTKLSDQDWETVSRP